MLDIILNILSVFWMFLKPILIILLLVVLVFVVLICVHIVLWYKKGKRFMKSEYPSTYKPRSAFKRLFYDFPKQFALDMYNINPDTFGEQGMIIFTGRQGSGKTVSMTQYLWDITQKYGNVKMITNYNHALQNDELTDWKQLCNYVNGIYGVAVGMDELQNWFSSADSKNFPPQMLEVITQNRKNRRVICGTAQSFYMLAKHIRTQCTEVRECHTFFRCITFVFKKEPILDFEGNVLEMKSRGSYFFVHNEVLRNMYDTYKVIERLVKVGFNEKEKLYD